jgi:glycosyltransferase involved in cell wall biosynthesis
MRVGPVRGSIWIDITEFFDQFRVASHPTGVSRTVLNLADRLIADPGAVFGAARPLFWHPLLRCALTTESARLSPLRTFFSQLRETYAAAGLATSSYASRSMKAIATSLPRPLRYRLFPTDSGVLLFAQWAQRERIRLMPANLAAGDSLFFPGSFWLGRYMPRLVARARATGTPITVFVHDTLLISHPEWLPGRHSRQFRRGCDALLPACAAIMCNSAHTKEELRRVMHLPAAMPIQSCRLADEALDEPSAPVPQAIAEWLGKTYVLFVSTIIPRKNHGLLLESWHRLWQRLGAETPYLLMVGGGSLDDRLAGMTDRDRAEGSRVVWLGSIDDRALEALYRGAWMTAYPSLGEGYGLPVAEALARGKICLAAPSGGVREVGADLIDVIDPRDPQSVVDRVSFYMGNPALLAAREAEIAARYRTTRWADVARTVRRVLEQTTGRPGV